MAGAKVYGTPAPKGSLQCRPGFRKCRSCSTPIIHHLVEDDPTDAGKVWRAQLEKAGAALLQRHGATLEEPVAVEATFVFERPKSAGKRPYPHVKPDLDKLARMLLDALESARVISNDARVVRLTVGKDYTGPDTLDRPGVVLRVSPMPAPNQPTIDA